MSITARHGPSRMPIFSRFLASPLRVQVIEHQMDRENDLSTREIGDQAIAIQLDLVQPAGVLGAPASGNERSRNADGAIWCARHWIT